MTSAGGKRRADADAHAEPLLTRVRIEGYSLLRDVELSFSGGLTVITGASGAGKSLLFDALGFAFGARTHRSILAAGTESCTVELELQLGEQQAAAAGAPWRRGVNTVSRTFSASGRARQSVNGAAVRVSDLQEFAARSIDFTGQFENRVLLDSSAHLALVDSFADSAGLKVRQEYQELYAQVAALRRRLAALRETEASRDAEIDLLRYQTAELEEASVAEGELASAGARLRMLRSAAAVRLAAQAAARLLSGDDDSHGAYELAAQARAQLQTLTELLGEGADEGPAADAGLLLVECSDLLERLRDGSVQASSLAQSVYEDPAEEAQLTERVDLILKLERKYNAGADDLGALLESKSERLSFLQDASQSPEELECQVESRHARLLAVGALLTAGRRLAAGRLREAVMEHLADLDFAAVEVEADLTPLDAAGPQGLDHAELLACLNPGEPLRPIAQVASGGEASRLLLGLKAGLAKHLPIQLMLLDEIEAGVGGDTAGRIAVVLRQLATTRQVFAISHLAPVAARAGQHLLVEKGVAAGRTSAAIRSLDGVQREAELARLLGVAEGADSRRLIAALRNHTG